MSTPPVDQRWIRRPDADVGRFFVEAIEEFGQGRSGMSVDLTSGPHPVFRDSEIVFALVARIGTNLDIIEHGFEKVLAEFGYRVNRLRLSSLMNNFSSVVTAGPDVDVEHGTGHAVAPGLLASSAPMTPEARRLRDGMRTGNGLRRSSRMGQILALVAAREILKARGGLEVLPRTVHIIRSLKHPDEVRALRQIYGAGFYVVAVTAPEAERRRHLEGERGCTPAEVDDLFLRDESDEDPSFVDGDREYGQQTRDTFHLADVFLPLGEDAELQRFVDLLFGHPHITPKQDEHMMFLAYSAALRSGDLSRQVGAVLMNEHRDVIGVGANDVPQAGGGQYWPGVDDHRDADRGGDANEEQRTRIVHDVLDKLRVALNVDERISRDAWIQFGSESLQNSLLMDVTEYGRPVHAEMAALLAAARTGASPRDGTLYCSTFPCHNCAKHLVGAGIRRVVYVEPYPKSQAMALFEDSLVLGRPIDDEKSRRVGFEQFVGVGPRRFFDLFSLTLSTGARVKRKVSGRRAEWARSPERDLRVPMFPNSYLERESLALTELISRSHPPATPAEAARAGAPRATTSKKHQNSKKKPSKRRNASKTMAKQRRTRRTT